MSVNGWQPLIDEHRVAIEEFLQRAERLSDAQWHAPRAEGKWSPAQETMHLALSYSQFASELRGGAPMSLKLTWYRRTMLRFVLLPRMLKHGRFRAGVRAPRELRPAEDPGAVTNEQVASVTRTELIARLRGHVDDYEAALADAIRNKRPRGVVHPYFGTIPLKQGIRFVTIHARHHLAHLP